MSSVSFLAGLLHFLYLQKSAKSAKNMRHIATRCTKCSCDTEVFCVSFAGQNKYLQETKFYSYFFASGYLQFTEMNFL